MSMQIGMFINIGESPRVLMFQFLGQKPLLTDVMIDIQSLRYFLCKALYIYVARFSLLKKSIY